MSKQPTIELRGKKVFLRPPKPADFREFSALTKASRARYRGFVRNHESRKAFTDFIRRSRRDDACGFIIRRCADGVIVGSMGLFNIVRLHVQAAFVGYAIGTPHAQQGYATEALQLVLRFAFRKLRLHRIEASIQPHNAPSIALVKRAGFAREGLARREVKIGGRWRDHERWAILAEDWRPLRRK